MDAFDTLEMPVDKKKKKEKKKEKEIRHNQFDL